MWFSPTLSQADRERALGQFKSKERPLMVATDVAARGLDIPDVEFVINYSFPLTIGEIHSRRNSYFFFLFFLWDCFLAAFLVSSL